MGQKDQEDRQQRVVRDHPHAQQRVQRHRRRRTDFYPPALRAEIERVNERVYHNVNNGVYRSGFARSQAAYEEAYDGLFVTLDGLEERLVAPALSGGRPDHRG